MGKAGTKVRCTKTQILLCVSKVLTCYNVGFIPSSICLFNRYCVNLECARHCAKCWGLKSDQNRYDPYPSGTENPVGMAPDNKARMIMCERGRRKGYPSLRGRGWGSGLGQMMRPWPPPWYHAREMEIPPQSSLTSESTLSGFSLPLG